MRFSRVFLCVLLIHSCLACSTDWQVVDKGLLSDRFGNEHFQNHDISAAVATKKTLILASDGGINGNNTHLLITDHFDSEPTAPVLILPPDNTFDIEGATMINQTPVFATSMSRGTFDDCHIIYLRNNSETNCLPVLSELTKVLADAFGAHWLETVLALDAKKGGINVEGLASYDGRLLIGLRSPLERFGKAIVVAMPDPSESRAGQSEIFTLELNGMGIRGIEYIESLASFVIIAGTVEKSSRFSLWLHSPQEGTTELLSISEFDELCRPESIVSSKASNSFFVFSERSGEECVGSSFDYIEVSPAVAD